jgi:hypothetical protein
MRPVTPNVIERAKEMRANNVSWNQIAKTLDVSAFLVRAATEPDFRNYRRERQRRHLQRERPHINHAVHHEVRGTRFPPAEVLREAERARELRLQPRSLTAELLGDPLPGRSALDQRRKN